MKRRLLLPLGFLAAACSAEAPMTPPPITPPVARAPATATPAPVPPTLRLPTDSVAPKRARVTLTLVPGENAIAGHVETDLEVKQPTKIVWMNANALTVSEAHAVVGGATLAARVITTPEDFVGFAFDSDLPVGEAKLVATYTGQVSPKDDRGVFREEEDGEKYLFSQFENIEARRAFPCFDEPSFKIPWELTIRTRPEHVAFSNTESKSETKEDGYRVFHFAETKPLPAYLVAFAVGPFEVVDAGKTSRGTPVRVVTPKGHRDSATWAVKTTAKIIDKLEGYFGIPYPYDKMDVVPIPRLSSFGAMENAGLITIAMNYALARKDEQTLQFERGYVDIMAHELAHQWFGDLVTTAWWDDIWLNEAFATWMGNKTVQGLYPEWRMDLRRARDASGAMDQDSLLTARKIRQEIQSNDDIQNAFDGITYEKGATVIGMFERYLGADAFQKGIHEYMQKHANQTATSKDFLADVSQGAGKDVRAAFSTFLDQPGVPTVSAVLSCDKKTHAARINLTQRRYFPIGSKGPKTPATWQTPVCVHYGDGKEASRACGMLSGAEGALTLPEAKTCPTWVMPNADALGYYRVAYTPEQIRALAAPAVAKTLPIVERISFIEDVMALVDSGELPVGEALALVPGLAKEPDPMLVRAGLEITGFAQGEYLDASDRPKLSKFVEGAFGKRARAMTFRPKASDAPEERLMRNQLVATVANVGEDAELLADAKKLAKAWLADRKALESEAVDTVLLTAAQHGDRAFWGELYDDAKKEKDDNRRNQILRALGQFRDPAVAKLAPPLVLSKDFDVRESLGLLFVDWRNERLGFEFIRDNFDAVVAQLPNETRSYAILAGSQGCSAERRAEIEAFFKDRAAKIVGGPRTFAQSLERVGLCAEKRRVLSPGLKAFFESKTR